MSLSLLLFCLVATLSPGPNNIMMMASGLNFGIRASIPHLLGVCVGVPAVFLAVGLGFAFFLEQFAAINTLIKCIGVVYLSYLAWQLAFFAH